MPLWNTQTQDNNVMTLVGDDEFVLGLVRFMPKTKKYFASTQRKYLGQYPSLAAAQKAVETQNGVEVKGSGRIIVPGGT